MLPRNRPPASSPTDKQSAARATRYLLTGDPLSADEAERIGLVTDVVEDDLLDDDALAFAHRLADSAPLALRYTKQAVNALVKDALGRKLRPGHRPRVGDLRQRRPRRGAGRSSREAAAPLPGPMNSRWPMADD